MVNLPETEKTLEQFLKSTSLTVEENNAPVMEFQCISIKVALKAVKRWLKQKKHYYETSNNEKDLNFAEAYTEAIGGLE